MKEWSTAALVLVMALLSVSGRAQAVQDSTATQAAEEADKVVTFGGSGDISSTYGWNRPYDGELALRSYDHRHGRFPRVGMIDLWVEHARRPVGFRVELDFGPAARINNAAEPSPWQPWEHLAEIYAGVDLDRGGKTYLEFGKWDTPVGFEYFEAARRWNQSGGLLFSWAVPSYHFGARFTRAFSDTDSLSLLVHRGWNAVGYPGHGPGLGLTGSKDAGGGWSLTGSWLAGPEDNGGGTATPRYLIDLVAQYEPEGAWAAGLEAIYGRHADYEVVPGTPVEAEWYGALAAVKHALDARQYLAARGEWLRDTSGALFGAAMDAFSLTLTYGRTVTANLEARLELRQDFAQGGRPFATTDPAVFTHTQRTIAAAAIIRL